jgi:hypothetical protein
MSIRVSVDDLADALAAHPWGYLITIDDQLCPRIIAVATELADGGLRCRTGESARANVRARPRVTMVFPPADHVGYSLIVDGTAELHTEAIVVRPHGAVLHRPAPVGEC